MGKKKVQESAATHYILVRQRRCVCAALAFKVNPDVQSRPNKQGAFLFKPNLMCVFSQH